MSKAKVHTKYQDAMYQPVPSVTTVLGIIAKGALIHSAWMLGCENKDYRKVWGQKADVGTLTHAMVLAHVSGKLTDMREYSQEDIDQAETCFLKYLEWEKQNPFEIILAEKPMVSEKYKFGGTPDLVCKLNGKITLIDFKSGKDIYPEMAYQLAAYDTMLREHGTIPEAWGILRIGRDEREGFEVRMFDSIELDWEVFLNALNLYKSIAKAKEGKR